jgi:hypothetical protein
MRHRRDYRKAFLARRQGSGTMVTTFASLDSVPEDCTPLFAYARQRSFHCSESWFRVSIAHALPSEVTPCLALYAEQCQPVVLFPLQMQGHGRALSSLTNIYTALWQPLIAPGSDPEAVRRAGRAFGKFCRAWPTVRLDALDAALPELPPLLEGIRDAGLLVYRFGHFGNWRQTVANVSWQAYLNARPGALRETIRRKLGRVGRDTGMQFELITAKERLDFGIDAYMRVYAGSWKEPEPFPRFNPALIRTAAELGVLRLGVLRQNGEPIAAQYWILANGSATVLKLAHLEAAKKSSPGTVLTALMIERLLDEDHVRELDFGRGDDPYKQVWAGERRQRIGLVLMNPRCVGGLLSFARHLARDSYRGVTARNTTKSRMPP